MRPPPRTIAFAAAGAFFLFIAITCTRSASAQGTTVAGGAKAALNPAHWSDSSLTIANLGHATLLMNFFGVRAISDPALFDRVGVSIGRMITIGPRRLTAPALRPDEIGPLDMILITHAHMDHLDLRSLAALPKSTTVIACSGCSDLIAPLGFTDVREIGWGQRTMVKGLAVTAIGARHWGRRWPPFGKDRGYNSYLLDGRGHRMLLACDSALTRVFARLHQNPPDVAAFSIGAYDPWIRNHANPGQVWQMFCETGALWLVPIHWGTFRLSKEPLDEPLERLITAAGAKAGQIVIRKIGDVWTMPAQAAKSAAPSAPDAHGLASVP